MPPDTSLARQLHDSPNKEVKDACASAEEMSAESQSFIRVDLPQEDGSILAVTSFQGGDAELTTIEAGSTVGPAVPRTDDSPPPHGVGDDGLLRNEAGEVIEPEEVA